MGGHPALMKTDLEPALYPLGDQVPERTLKLRPPKRTPGRTPHYRLAAPPGQDRAATECALSLMGMSGHDGPINYLDVLELARGLD